MKKFFLSFTMTVVTLAFLNSINAQESPEQRKALMNDIEKKMAPTEIIEFKDTLNPCKKVRPEITTQGRPDNFTYPTEPTTPSPNLSNLIQSTYGNIGSRPYDQIGCDRPFATSFKIKSCRICYATLEIRFKRENCYLACNDAIRIGVVGPLTSGGTPGWISAYNLNASYIWSNANCNVPLQPSPATRTYILPATVLNNYIFNGPCPVNGSLWVDVFVQDDTNVDYAKLTIWNCQ